MHSFNFGYGYDVLPQRVPATTPSPAAWHPLMISGARLWDRTETATVQVGTGGISRWLDAGGSGEQFDQGDNTKRPQLEADGITFTDAQSLQNTTSYGGSGAAWSIFYVGRIVSLPTARFVHALDQNVFIGMWGNKLGGVYLDGSPAYYGTIDATVGRHIMGVRRKADGTLIGRLDGKNSTDAATSFADAIRFGLNTGFAGGSALEPTEYALDAVLIVPGDLSMQDMYRFEGWAAWKFGDLTLPAWHPYTAAAPLVISPPLTALQRFFRSAPAAPVYTAAIAGDIGMSSNHRSAALGQDDAVHGVAGSTTTYIRTAAGVVTRPTWGATIPSGGQFGLTEGSDGCLYSPPWNDAAFAKLDPIANTLTFLDFGLSLAPLSGKCAGINANTAKTKLVTVPSAADYVVVVDVVAQTAQTVALPITGSNKFRFGITLPDDRVIFIPYNAGVAIIFDFADNSMTTTNWGLGWTANQALWYGGAYVHTGKIICSPFGATQSLVITPDLGGGVGTAVLTDFGAGALWSGSNKFTKPVMSPSTKLYLPPYDKTKVGVIDVETETYSETDFGLSMASASKFINSAMNTDNYVDLTPLSAYGVLRIGAHENNFHSTVLRSAWRNAA